MILRTHGRSCLGREQGRGLIKDVRLENKGELCEHELLDRTLLLQAETHSTYSDLHKIKTLKNPSIVSYG